MLYQGNLAKDLTDIHLGTASLPTQISLRLLWYTDTDCFKFKVNSADYSYTRHGVLWVINSVFDSFGFLQPVIVEEKILLREMMSLTRELIGMTPAGTTLQQVDLMDVLIKPS